jgi:hypothetical protein
MYDIDHKRVQEIVDELLQLLMDRKVTILEADSIGMRFRCRTRAVTPPDALFVRHQSEVFDFYVKKLDDVIRKYKKYEKASNEWVQASSDLDEFQKKYDDSVREIQTSLEIRAKAALDAKAKGDEKLLSEYKQDYEMILEMRRKVKQKEDLL